MAVGDGDVDGEGRVPASALALVPEHPDADAAMTAVISSAVRRARPVMAAREGDCGIDPPWLSHQNG